MPLVANAVLALWVLYTIGLGALFPLALFGSLDVSEFGAAIFNTHSLAAWGGLICVSFLLRNVMIHFLGEIVAYVPTSTLNRFEEVRTGIKERVSTAAKAVYSGEYEGVVWVGYSLGSAVAYDALNAVIIDDELSGRPHRAVERTRLLLTVGSPLDSVALLSASQWERAATETQEVFAASLQPLVLDYNRFRRIPWVNIWSPADIIGRSIEFYDDASKSDGRAVVNIVDPKATTPLLAHAEYWDNSLLYEQIYAGLVRVDIAAAAAAR